MKMFLGFFESDAQRLGIYNRAFEIGERVKDANLRERMYRASLKFRAANREFAKLQQEAERKEPTF